MGLLKYYRHIIMRLLHKIKLKYFIPVSVIIFFLCDYMGVFVHMREKDFHTEFTYPLEGDLYSWIGQLKRGERPDVEPINDHSYTILKHAKSKCVEEDGVHYISLRVIYLVKSAMDHFDRRKVIRDTWGYERRFSDVEIRTVFLLGSQPGNVDLQAKIESEYQTHRDLVQGDFVDSYFNNTMKTMMGLRWAVEQCPTSRFYFFVDDDYYVSTRNVLRFLRNPVNYPGYLEEPVLNFDEVQDQRQGRKLQQMIDFDIPEDVRLFTGYVFHTPPLRHKPSKWYVPLEEYPFHLWPPYVTAGAYILSRDALVEMYYASYFVKRFRFDDIYMGIIAKKIDLEPFHSPEFYFDRKPYHVGNYQYVVASHGFSNPSELGRVWNQQKQAGNA